MKIVWKEKINQFLVCEEGPKNGIEDDHVFFSEKRSKKTPLFKNGTIDL